MKAILMGALALMALAAVPARAADDPFKGTNCKSEELNQGQLDYCAGKTYEAADAKLNALYRELTAKYDAPNAAMLKKAEVAWIAFRDAECNYETNGTAGGTINPMEQTICGTNKTNARIAELTAQLKCEEGDMLCNMPVQ
ncbi:MAG TPA: lysozyme inhibitor LprI family protein [Rhizomicrobium sp.]|jgi:uncharacterized protein YecT (DUF1311 family)|nr:lysozyme inhibitor LprI family protein [Rhizomicrobium sp.]